MKRYVKIIKNLLICGCVLFGLVFVGMNIWQTWREIGWNYDAERYVDFVDMKVNWRKNHPKVVFAEKHIPPGSTVYMWDDPQDNDWIVIECLIADMNYFLYPAKFKYGGGNLRTPCDYIWCDRFCYGDLKLYMAFFDVDEHFAEYAENEGMVILKRKSKISHR